MSLGTRVDSNLGVVTTNNGQGLSVAIDTANKGFAPYQVDAIQTIVTSTVLVAGNAGVLTVSGSSALTQTMPLASSCPGAMFIFRNISATAHVLTGSLETAGTKVFATPISGAGGSGSKLTFGATAGFAVTMVSDGLSFQVLGSSGTFALT